jgi:hypothetical protein
MAVAWGTPPSGANTPRTYTDEDAHSPSTHQMQSRRVAGAAAHHNGNVERGHELHKVQRFDGLGDVLGRDYGTLDDEYIEASLDGRPVVALYPLGGEARGGDHALVLYLLNAAEDQLLFNRLGVDLLHHPRGLVLG